VTARRRHCQAVQAGGQAVAATERRGVNRSGAHSAASRLRRAAGHPHYAPLRQNFTFTEPKYARPSMSYVLGSPFWSMKLSKCGGLVREVAHAQRHIDLLVCLPARAEVVIHAHAGAHERCAFIELRQQTRVQRL